MAVSCVQLVSPRPQPLLHRLSLTQAHPVSVWCVTASVGELTSCISRQRISSALTGECMRNLGVLNCALSAGLPFGWKLNDIKEVKKRRNT